MLKGEVAAMTDQAGSAGSGPGRIRGGSDWDWFGETYPFGIDLMFARGVAPERVIEALGADPAAARLLSAEDVDTPGYSGVRVGGEGEWTFAMGGTSLSTQEYEQVGLGLSTGTEVVLFLAGMELDYFFYFADGVTVTSFEPLLSAWRDGTDPDRFVPQMRHVGLDVDPPPDDAEEENDDDAVERDPTIALLEMLTLTLGIRLSRETAMGPLLTVRPGG